MWTAVADAKPKWDRIVAVLTEGGQAVVAAWGNPTGEGACWYAPNEDEHPSCWHQGICWEVNEDEEPSDHPKWWAELPPKPVT